MPVAESLKSFDLAALATNVGVFLGFLGAALLGLKRGLTKWTRNNTSVDKGIEAEVTAATLIDNQTLRQWSASNEACATATAQLTLQLGETTRSMYANADRISAAMGTLNREVQELRYEVRQLKDKTDGQG